MDIALRILHIVFGVYWAGVTAFDVFILEPRLRTLGSANRSRVFRALVPIMSPSLGLSAVIILGTGIAMTFRMRGSLEGIFATGWGWAMLVAFVATVSAFIVAGVFSLPATIRLKRLERSMEGREPNPDELRQLEQIMDSTRTMERILFVLIFIGLVAMPVARFV